MILQALLLPLAFGVLLASAGTRAKSKRVDSKFVSTNNGAFTVNGSDFRFIGTNAYWLPTLTSVQDISNVFGNMSAAGIKVVKTFAFNDVEVIPENGTWFQLVVNGTTQINNGTNGLPMLDAVIQQAEIHGIYLVLSLTNNWDPRSFDNITAGIANLTDTVDAGSIVRRDVTPGKNSTLPRNFLSNDYGGMDLYVRQFGQSLHDQFYTNETIISAFENYTTQVVSRYVNSPAVFSWEIANDPRCNSSVAASASCNTTTVTSFMSRIAQHIQLVDPNHLISAGAHGFVCPNCKKLFPLQTAPTATPSPAAGSKRRNVPKPLTEARILQQRKEARKKTRALAGKQTEGVRIRGRWIATPTRRQADISTVGSAFDGSQGVDSEDIINIPQIGYGTFQLFPDQNTYGPDDPNLPSFNNTVQNGIDWINTQAEIAGLFGKPVALTGFGLVTQNNSAEFVPFNSSVAPFASDSTAGANSSQTYGVTNQQQADAYLQWLDTGISAGLQGMMQYQWGASNLTVQEQGTDIVPDQNSTSTATNQNATGISPNDGYSIQGQTEETTQGILQEASQSINSD